MSAGQTSSTTLADMCPSVLRFCLAYFYRCALAPIPTFPHLCILYNSLFQMHRSGSGVTEYEVNSNLNSNSTIQPPSFLQPHSPKHGTITAILCPIRGVIGTVTANVCRTADAIDRHQNPFSSLTCACGSGWTRPPTSASVWVCDGHACGG